MEPDEVQCNECGETWVDDGSGECPFCGSTDIHYPSYLDEEDAE